MVGPVRKTWLRRRVEDGVRRGQPAPVETRRLVPSMPVDPFWRRPQEDRSGRAARDPRLGTGRVADEQRMADQDRDADADERVGDVERWPLILVPVDEQKIGHLAEEDAVDQVPDGATEHRGDGDEKLGAGVGILVYDASMIPNRKLRDLAVDVCEKNKITYHLGTVERGGTDAGRFHIYDTGVPSLVIFIATRYIHSHSTIMDRKDYDSAVKLLTELTRRLDKKTVAGL
jgi:hypothetical protein